MGSQVGSSRDGGRDRLAQGTEADPPGTSPSPAASARFSRALLHRAHAVGRSSVPPG